MIVDALVGFAWGCGAAAIIAVFAVVFSSVRSLGDDA